MRFLLFIAALSLAGCSTEKATAPDAAASLATGSYRGEGRDALCVAGPAGGQRAGFIIYGTGDENCSARGAIAQQGGSWSLTPQGDAECRISVSRNDGRLALGPGIPSCAYYCSPGATFAGKSFRRDARIRQVSDFGGDPLC